MSRATTRKQSRRKRRPGDDSLDAARAKPAISLDLPVVTPVTARLGRRRLVVFVACTLLAFGIVMVASASSGEELLQGRDQWSLLRKQAIFAVVGLLAMVAAMQIPLEFVRRLALPVAWVSALLVAAVMVPGIGHSALGATRWINLGFFQLQPSEPLKLAVIILLADHLARYPPPQHWVRDFLLSPGGAAFALAGLVVAFQSDLGSGLVIGSVTIVLYMLAGTKWSVLWKWIGPGLALVALSILTEQYRRERFLAFLDPWKDPDGNGYQLIQAVVSIGSGGPFGVGLGHSVQKIAFLPEAHTDMIFAIIIEELGVFGVGLIIGSFAVLAAVGARIAMRATTRFGALLAAGITAMVVGQASINIAGVTGVMPLTGIPLPLVSYGGSSLIVTLTALGLLANVATERRPSRAVEVTVADERRITIDGDDDLDEASIDYLAEDDDDSNSEYDSADAAPIAGARGGWRHRRASRAGARRR